jgi:hypothetical protein
MISCLRFTREPPNLSKSDRRQVYRTDEQKDEFDYNEYVDIYMTWYEDRIDSAFQLFSQQLLKDQHRHKVINNKGKIQPESSSDNKPSAVFCFLAFDTL